MDVQYEFSRPEEPPVRGSRRNGGPRAKLAPVAFRRLPHQPMGRLVIMTLHSVLPAMVSRGFGDRIGERRDSSRRRVFVSRARPLGSKVPPSTSTAVRCRVRVPSLFSLLYSHHHIHLAYFRRCFRLAMHYFSQLCHYE